MLSTENTRYWEQKPNRDEVLDRSYSFVEAVSNNNLNEAGQIVMLPEPGNFETGLRKSLQDFVMSWLEDDEMSELKGDIVKHLTNPGEMDEETIQPEFEGNEFFLKDGEKFSIHLGFKKKPTNLRFHFTVCEQDELYFIKFLKITTNPDLPSLHF